MYLEDLKKLKEDLDKFVLEYFEYPDLPNTSDEDFKANKLSYKDILEKINLAIAEMDRFNSNLGKEIIVNDVENGEVKRNYGIFLDYDGKERYIALSLSYQENPDFEQIDNCEFLDNCEDLNEDDKTKIQNWLFDNSDSWRQ